VYSESLFFHFSLKSVIAHLNDFTAVLTHLAKLFHLSEIFEFREIIAEDSHFVIFAAFNQYLLSSSSLSLSVSVKSFHWNLSFIADQFHNDCFNSLYESFI
jgi:hypothetical protein